MKYAVIIEKGDTSYGAYVPDLPGCVAVGESCEEVKQLIREAIAFHLEGYGKRGCRSRLPPVCVSMWRSRRGQHEASL
jgi:predicted RNase H-like HicB family nuclease